MKKLNAVRWAAFLITFLANADAAGAQMMVDRPICRCLGGCERCGQTEPTVPPAPVVFRARPTIGPSVPQNLGNLSVGVGVRNVQPNSAVPVRDEFDLDAERPAVGAVFTR